MWEGTPPVGNHRLLFLDRRFSFRSDFINSAGRQTYIASKLKLSAGSYKNSHPLPVWLSNSCSLPQGWRYNPKCLHRRVLGWAGRAPLWLGSSCMQRYISHTRRWAHTTSFRLMGTFIDLTAEYAAACPPWRAGGLPYRVPCLARGRSPVGGVSGTLVRRRVSTILFTAGLLRHSFALPAPAPHWPPSGVGGVRATVITYILGNPVIVS